MSKILAHAAEPPPAVTDVAPDLPGELDEIIARAMAKRPEDRFGSAGELGRAAIAAAGRAAPPPPKPVPEDGRQGGPTIDPGAPTVA